MSLSGEYLEQFDWDEANIAHIARHGVTPEEAEQVLNSATVEIDERFVDGELRYAEVGKTLIARFLVVAWVMRENKLRVVTAFVASKTARQMWLDRHRRGGA